VNIFYWKKNHGCKVSFRNSEGKKSSVFKSQQDYLKSDRCETKLINLITIRVKKSALYFIIWGHFNIEYNPGIIFVKLLPLFYS